MTLPSTPLQLLTPPDTIEPPTRGYLTALLRQLTAALLSRPSREQPQDSVLLASPNGAVYTVAVNNAGALVVTKIYG